MVASEVLPYAKTGGLADVAAALPAALAALGHQVVVAMPRYRGVQVSGELLTTFVLDIGAEHLHVQIFRERMAGGAVLWLVDIPALYDREGFYGVGSHDHPDSGWGWRGRVRWLPWCPGLRRPADHVRPRHRRRAPARADLPRAHGGGRGAVARRHPGALRPRGLLRRRQPRSPRQPAPVRGAGAGRVRSGDRHRLLARRRARARLAGRAGAGLPADALRDASRPGRRAVGVHDPQHRLHGGVRCRLDPGARPRLGSLHAAGPRVLGAGQPAEGGHQLQREGDDGQPALRRGNPHARVRLRARGRARVAARRPGRDPERHRRRYLEPGHRPLPARAVHGRHARGEAGIEACLAAGVRAAVGRRGAGPSRHRHGVADGRPEGPRSDQQRRQRAAAPRRAVRGARHRRAGLRGDVAAPGGAVPGSDRRPRRLRRGPVAPHRGRQRSVPDAVALRAVRAQPDVQPALRHAAAGAGHRRPRRHGRELRPVHRPRHRVQVLGSRPARP